MFADPTRSRSRRARRYAPEVGRLEPRALLSSDLTPPSIAEVASPNTLWPPNGKSVAVVVSGAIGDSQSGVNASTVHYNVIDEYGQMTRFNQPISLNPDGTYAFTVLLPARRAGQDHDGRQYVIQVVASDLAGNQAVQSAVVTVPHDQGNHFGGGPGLIPGGKTHSHLVLGIGAGKAHGNGGVGGTSHLGRGRGNPGGKSVVTHVVAILPGGGNHQGGGQGNHGQGDQGNGNGGHGNGNGHDKGHGHG